MSLRVSLEKEKRQHRHCYSLTERKSAPQTKVHIHVFPPEQKLNLLETLALGLRDKQETEYEDGRQTPAEYPESSGLWD